MTHPNDEDRTARLRRRREQLHEQNAKLAEQMANADENGYPRGTGRPPAAGVAATIARLADQAKAKEAVR